MFITNIRWNSGMNALSLVEQPIFVVVLKARQLLNSPHTIRILHIYIYVRTHATPALAANFRPNKHWAPIGSSTGHCMYQNNNHLSNRVRACHIIILFWLNSKPDIRPKKPMCTQSVIPWWYVSSEHSTNLQYELKWLSTFIRLI